MNNIAQPWKRLLAYFIDSAFYLMIPIFLIYLFSFSSDATGALSHASSYLIFLFFVYPMIYSLFISLLISVFGGTVGKLLTGTRIVLGDGQNLSFWKAFFRNHIGYIVSGFLLELGFIWILIDKERRAWHDQIVGTYVIVQNRWVAILGVFSLAIFVFIEFVLISVSIFNFKSNGAIYTAIIDEIQTSLQASDTGANK